MKSRVLITLLVTNLILTFGILGYIYHNRNIKLDLSREIITVRGLVVTDSTGIERVIIGAPLPPPQMHGYRFDRGENADVSGVMLYDSEGQERSGYVTDNNYGNVFFTLDSKTSQRVLFIAEPQGASTLKIWGRNGNQIELGAGDNDAWIKAVRNGKVFNFMKE